MSNYSCFLEFPGRSPPKVTPLNPDPCSLKAARLPKSSQNDAKREPKGAKRDPKNVRSPPRTAGVSADPRPSGLTRWLSFGFLWLPFGPLLPPSGFILGPYWLLFGSANPWNQFVYSEAIRMLVPNFGPNGHLGLIWNMSRTRREGLLKRAPAPVGNPCPELVSELRVKEVFWSPDARKVSLKASFWEQKCKSGASKGSFGDKMPGRKPLKCTPTE